MDDLFFGVKIQFLFVEAFIFAKKERNLQK